MNIPPTEKQVAEYQRLLKSEWHNSLARAVISLIWSMIPERQQESAWPVSLLLNPKLNGSLPADAFAAVIRKITGFNEFVHPGELPKLPSSYEAPRRASKPVREATQLTTCLTLHSLLRLKGDVGFLHDVQSLAFQAAIQHTLPGLRARHEPEHAILLHAMSMFAHEYFFLEPSHYCYLRSQIFDYLDDSPQRLRYLSLALGLTARDDHSYLTKAQEYWSELLDHDEFDEAESFLLSLYRSSPAEQQAEVREMIDSAFRFIAAERSSA